MTPSLDSTGAWEGGTGTGERERVECERQPLLSSSNGDSSTSRVQGSGVGIEDDPVAGEDAESPNDALGLRAPTKGLLFKLKAIDLAKRPGGQGKDGTVGACAAAEALNVRETTLRMWMRREAEIRQDAKKAGINLNEINNEMPDPTIKLKTKNSLPARTSLLTQFEEPLRQWVVLQIEASQKNMVPYEHVMNHARSLDPSFMREIPANSPPAEKSAFKRRARDWFQRFCKRHHITMTRYGRSKGGGDRQSQHFDTAFKLRAIELARDVVDGGKGPSGTRGKEEAGRRMGVTANAIWKWQKKEQQLRDELASPPAGTGISSMYAPPTNVMIGADQNLAHHVAPPAPANQFQNHSYMPVASAALPGPAVHGVGDLHPAGMSSSYPPNIAMDRQ